MFSPVLEAVSKQQISASSLQLLFLLPSALGREIAPSTTSQHPRDESLLPYHCFWSIFLSWP